ncbi:MAG: undecaprenyl-diphosphate phosphatase [Acidobacteria bacterium]|nr:undecaprenyl-diphosphate phosphatase [Acidobacteriota bacterium]
MPLYQAVVLAVVQGLTEFLPISSTAHLVLVPWVMGWQDPGLAFDVALHLGTLLAVVAYFARTWLRLLSLAFIGRAWPDAGGEEDRDLATNPRLFWFLVLATVPAGLAGLAFEHYVETTWRSPYVIAVMMIAIGLVLWWAERKGRFEKNLGRVSLMDSLAIGLAQAVAIIPGTSRSGITMAAAMARGAERPAAARFSFLLATPIIAGAALKTGWNVLKSGPLAADMRMVFAVGVAVSAISGFLVIGFLVRYLQRGTFKFFIWYRIVCGIIIIALAIFFRGPIGSQ